MKGLKALPLHGAWVTEARCGADGRKEPSLFCVWLFATLLRFAIRDARCAMPDARCAECDARCDRINDKDAALSMRIPKRDLGSHWYFIKDVSFVFRAYFMRNE